MKRQSPKTLLAFLLPIAVLGLWIVQLQVHGQRGVDVMLPVEGYDPIDPISGHYVIWRLSLGENDPCRSPDEVKIESSEQRCLCFVSNSKPQPNWAGACTQKPKTCKIFLQGTCSWSGFTAGVERFFIPEAHSRWLQVVPPHSSIVVTLNHSGQGLVKAFYPEGMVYEEWIQKKKAESQTPP